MKILAKIKKRPLVLGILFAMLIIGIVYAADSYQINSGAQVTIDEHTVCKKVTNNNALAIFVPTKTADEWTAFRTYASGVTLGDCTYYCDEDNDGHYTKILVDCPSGRTSGSVGDDCDDSCATCYPGSTSYTSSPDGLDQDCNGVVDNVVLSDCSCYCYDFPDDPARSCTTYCATRPRPVCSEGYYYAPAQPGCPGSGGYAYGCATTAHKACCTCCVGKYY